VSGCDKLSPPGNGTKVVLPYRAGSLSELFWLLLYLKKVTSKVVPNHAVQAYIYIEKRGITLFVLNLTTNGREYK
jgi:hypothetical protein